MATTRLLRTSKPIQLSSAATASSSCMTGVRYKSRASLMSGDHNYMVSAKGERNLRVVAVTASSAAASDRITTSQPLVPVPQRLSYLAAFIASICHSIPLLFHAAVRRKPWNLQPQMLIEKAIIDCRFLTLLAVAGSLLGSVLCFVEGCFLVIQAYAHYFNLLSQRLDQAHVMHLLIEAIDMFLVGTALLVFGVGLYVMFIVGTRTARKEKEPRPCGSNLLGLFHMKSAPRWVGMQSIAEAKSKIGHAVMMILQVGLLDKFKDIPLVTGLDLACFAAAVLTSSASIFVLSRLHRY